MSVFARGMNKTLDSLFLTVEYDTKNRSVLFICPVLYPLPMGVASRVIFKKYLSLIDGFRDTRVRPSDDL
jgi:hypothetical protein